MEYSQFLSLLFELWQRADKHDTDKLWLGVLDQITGYKNFILMSEYTDTALRDKRIAKLHTLWLVANGRLQTSRTLN